MKRPILIVLTILLTCLFLYTDEVVASANSTISVQGKIVNSIDGTNIDSGATACVQSGADTCDIRVDIYSENSGGILLWSETHVDIELGDNSGIFNLKLNSICANWDSPSLGGCLGSGIDWGADDTLFVEMLFDADGDGNFSNAEIFSRSEMSSVPFAYYADTAGSIEGGLDTVYQDDNDKVLNINDIAGLEFLSSTTGDIVFDLQSTGDILFQDNDSTFLTISEIGEFEYILDGIDNPDFRVANLGSGEIIFDLVSTGGLSLQNNGVDFFNFNSDNSIEYNPNDFTDSFLILNGNLDISNGGTPDLALDGLDVYVQGTFEVDSNADFGANIDFNSNEAIAFRVENADGSISVPLCDAANQGRHYYDTSDDNAYICTESSPSTYSWFNLTQTLTATSTKVVTVGSTGDYASIAAAAGYLNTLTGGIILLAPEIHSVANSVDLENITLIGANIDDTVVNINGSGSLRSRQTQFENLTIRVDAGITATSGIDMLLEIGVNSSITFQWVDFDINGTKFLIGSTEATSPTIQARFESTSAISGTGNIVQDQASANLSNTSKYIVASQGDSGALNFQDWDVQISGSGNVITSGSITTTPLDTIYIYPGMNIQGAIDSLPNGGVVILLPGTHSISNSISILSDNIEIRGYGDASIISASGFVGSQTTAAIHVGTQDGLSPANNIVLAEFKLEVTGSGGSDIHGIRIAGGEDNQIRGITVQKISGQSGSGTSARIAILLLDGVTAPLARPVVKDSIVQGNGGINYFTDGIHLTGGQDYGFPGIWMNGAGIENALIESNNIDYVRETVAVFIGVRDSSLFNNRFSRMGQGSTSPFGVFLGNSTRLNINSNIISGATASNTTAFGIDAVTPAFSPSFTDSIINNNVIDGFALGGNGFSTGVSIGNGINSTVSEISFQNNIIGGSNGSAGNVALEVDGNFDNNSISNNIFKGGVNPWNTGINIISSAAERNLLRGNTFENVNNNVIDSGTSTKFGVASHRANINPTINDDSADGYSIGTIWLNNSTGDAFISVDDAVGAAVWEQINGIGAGSSTLDDVYSSDPDKVLGINDAQGLEFLSTTAGDIVFDLQSTGDILFQDNDSTFLTISDTGGFEFILDAADNPDFVVTNDGTGDIRFDLTSLGGLSFADNGVPFFIAGADNSIEYSADDATDLFTISNGNLSISNAGVPNLALDGLDVYVEGTLEVDSVSDFGDNLNLNDNQALGFRIENLPIAPICDPTTAGKLYHNTTDTFSYICNGSSWLQIDGSAGGPLSVLAYGELYSTGGVGETINTTWTPLTQFTNAGDSSGTTPDPATDTLTINQSGLYLVQFALSLQNSATVNIDAAVFINGILQPELLADDYIFSGERDSTVVTGIVDLNASDVLDVRLQTTPSQNITLNAGNLVVYTLAGGTVSGVNGDLDDVYDQDIDKVINIDDPLGLEFLSTTAGNINFDLQSTGDLTIENNGTSLFTVLDTGFVGIGTNGPLAPLDINSAGSAASPSLIFEGDSDTGLFHPNADEIGFSIGGGESIRLTGNGLRFIGKTSDPVTLVDGDIWFRSDTGNLKMRADGRTQEIQTVSVAQVYQAGTTTFNAPTPIAWDCTSTNFRFIDSTFTHSSSTDPSRVTINDAGLYEISYSVAWDTTANGRRTSTCRFFVNGSVAVPAVGTSHAYARNNNDDWESNSSSFMYSFNAGDYYEIQCESTGSNGSITTLANESWTSIKLVRRN